MRIKNWLRRDKKPLPARPDKGPSRAKSADERNREDKPGIPETGEAIPSSGHPYTNEPDITWDSFWAEAYQTVKKNPEYSSLLENFESHLAENSHTTAAITDATDGPGSPRGSGQVGGTARLELIQQLAEKKLDKLPDAQLAFSVYGKPIVVRKVVFKAFAVVSTFKPIISAAVSSEPHTALAWAGVLAILPILENVFQQDEDAANGLSDILFLLARYQEIQNKVLPTVFQGSNQVETTHQLLSAIRENIVKVYSQVYVYQIRFVLQYARKKPHRALRNLLSADAWKNMWTDIESTSQHVDQAIQVRVNVKTMETWQATLDIKESSEQIERRQQAIQEGLQTIHETDVLKGLPFAGNAVFDSAEIWDVEAPCMEGTQHRILHEIQDWARDPAGEMIFWLHGMAGTGKTSVALTVAQALEAGKPFTRDCKPLLTAFLGASFFFKQGDATRDSTKTFFPTLARCLAEVFPDLRAPIVSAAAKKLAIETTAPLSQLKHLILRPMSSIDRQAFLPIRLIIVVDALDECVNRKEVEELLVMLPRLKEVHQVQLRLLITSRPDTHIQGSFGLLPHGLSRSMMLEKIQPSAPGKGDDITLYLTYMLRNLAQKHGVDTDWVDDTVIEKLRKKADGLFIYAVTVCRFLDTPDFPDKDVRQKRLDQIFQDVADTDAPQQKVDEIYLKVLSFPELAELSKTRRDVIFARTGRVLGFLAVLFEPVSVMSLGEYLSPSFDRATLDDLMKRLHSVVAVPQNKQRPLSLVHLSFRDFILNKDRSRQLHFRVDEDIMHQEVFERCLDFMSRDLHQDICSLVMPGTSVSEVPHSQIEHNIPAYLQYACRYWVDHLAKLESIRREQIGLQDNGDVHKFLQKNILYWLEVMSLLQDISTAIHAMNRLQSLTNPSKHPNLSSLLYDAKRFILNSSSIIAQAPLQIYCSALIFSPEASVIRSLFQDLMPTWIRQRPAVAARWTSHICNMGGGEEVGNPAFSPSGELIAATGGGTMRFWDYNTGIERFRFDEKYVINTFSFSPDGQRVAYPNGDFILVREFRTGRVKRMRDGVPWSRISFSRTNSNIMASAPHDDDTVRIWNVDEERLMHVYRFEDDSPTAFAFSLDGEQVIIGSRRGHVKLWSMKSDQVVTLHKLRRGSINSVALARNGEGFAVESDEKGARLWNSTTKTLLFDTQPSWHSEALYRHSPDSEVFDGDRCSSEEFADRGSYRTRRAREESNSEALKLSLQDERLVVTAISRTAIEIRDVGTWDILGCINRPTQPFKIALSRDMELAAITSFDVVQLWDLKSETGGDNSGRHVPGADLTTQVQFLPGHENLVLTNSESDGKLLSLVDGHVKQLPGPVGRVTPSPDGRFFVAKSFRDYCLWDRDMTKQMFGPEAKREIVFSPDSKSITLVSKDSGIRIIDSTTMGESTPTNGFSYDFQFSSNGRMATFLDWSGQGDEPRLELWDLTKKEVASTLSIGRGGKATFSPDGLLVAVWGWRFSEQQSAGVRLLDLATRADAGVLSADEIDFLAFHPQSHLIATASRTSHISVYETQSRTKRFVLTHDTDGPYKGEIFALEMSGTGKLLVASDELTGVTFQLWDPENGKEIGRHYFPSQLRYSLVSSFSEDSRYLKSDHGRIPVPFCLPGQEDAGCDETWEVVHDCLYVIGQWVYQGFERLLCLPVTQQLEEFDVKDDTLLLKHEDHFTTIKFDLANTPVADSRRVL